MNTAPLARGTAIFVTVFAVAWFAIAYTKNGAQIAPFWPANAVALTLLLRGSGGRVGVWIGVAAAFFAANFVAGLSLLPIVLFTVFNICEVATSFALIRGVPGLAMSTPFGEGWRRGATMMGGALVGPLVGASLAAAFLAPVLGAPPSVMWLGWWLPATLAILVVVPMGLLTSDRDLARLRTPGALVEAALCVIAICLIAVLMEATGRIAFLFLFSPVLCYAAVRFRSGGASIAVAGTALYAVPMASGDLGHISSGLWDRGGFVLLVQGFLSVNAIAALALATLLDERDGLIGFLRTQKDEVTAKSQAKSRLLTHVSHEIRTPLNAIQGLGERLAARSHMDERQSALLNGMLEAAASLQTLANDLLDTARIEQGALELDPVAFKPAPMLRSLVAEAEVERSDSGTHITLDVDDDLVVWADTTRFRQIAQNLLSNGVKHGGAYGSIAMSLRGVRDGVRLDVVDRGPGFPAGAGLIAFEPFALAGGAASARSAGVGLSLVKLLAEAHGGTVGLSSVPHMETRVWVELPHEGAGAAAARDRQDAEVDPAEIFRAAS